METCPTRPTLGPTIVFYYVFNLLNAETPGTRTRPVNCVPKPHSKPVIGGHYFPYIGSQPPAPGDLSSQFSPSACIQVANQLACSLAVRGKWCDQYCTVFRFLLIFCSVCQWKWKPSSRPLHVSNWLAYLLASDDTDSFDLLFLMRGWV